MFPVRIVFFVAYIIDLAWNMALSAIRTAWLCITGRIEPTVMEIDTILGKEVSQMVLANSITLTPGTLTISIDNPEKKLRVAVLTPRTKADIIPFEKYIKGMLE
jgi:energy-converting hydrogenase B subunit A